MADRPGQSSEAIEALPVGAEEVEVAQEPPQIPSNATAGSKESYSYTISYRETPTNRPSTSRTWTAKRRRSGGPSGGTNNEILTTKGDFK
jgi:hypothetical protein